LIIYVGAGSGGIFHAAGIEAENLAQLGVIGRQGGLPFLLGSKFRSLQNMVQVGQQVGTDHGRHQHITAFGTAALAGSAFDLRTGRWSLGANRGGSGHGADRYGAESIVLDTIPEDLCTLLPNLADLGGQISLALATRQTSSSGRSKSPRIQVVLPEDVCERLATLAEAESRTVSNMAKVLIQQGLDRMERQQGQEPAPGNARFREVLERQQRMGARRLKGIPRRLRLPRTQG
jgi:hypothetical protein